MSADVVLVFDTAGNGHCLHTEAIDLAEIGPLTMTRASNIEWSDEHQAWNVIQEPRGEYPFVLFQHESRATCLRWEREHFNAQLLAT